jgi:hypothetical protein
LDLRARAGDLARFDRQRDWQQLTRATLATALLTRALSEQWITRDAHGPSAAEADSSRDRTDDVAGGVPVPRTDTNADYVGVGRRESNRDGGSS